MLLKNWYKITIITIFLFIGKVFEYCIQFHESMCAVNRGREMAVKKRRLSTF